MYLHQKYVTEVRLPLSIVELNSMGDQHEEVEEGDWVPIEGSAASIPTHTPPPIHHSDKPKPLTLSEEIGQVSCLP